MPFFLSPLHTTVSTTLPQDLADAFSIMKAQRRYRSLFWIVDTCQAESLAFDFYSPDTLSLACSKDGQNSYSHHSDWELGVSVIDRFTHQSLDFFADHLKDVSMYAYEQKLTLE